MKFSGAKPGQPAALRPIRSCGCRGKAVLQTVNTTEKETQGSCVVSRRRAATSPQCNNDSTRMIARRMLQACRILTAATAAALALQAAPVNATSATRWAQSFDSDSIK